MKRLLNVNSDFSGLLKLLGDKYPLMQNLDKIAQDRIWHAEGNVAVHTDMVISEVYKLTSNRPNWSDELKVSMILGAFFHDIGKKEATKEVFKEGRICIGAPRHEEIGFNRLFFDLKEDNCLAPYACNILQIVGYHNIPKISVLKDLSIWHLLEYRYKFNPEVLYEFSKCDFQGRISNDKEAQLEYVELYKEQIKEYNLWEDDFEDPIYEVFQSYDKKSKNFLYQKALTDLKSGSIFTPEEALSKYHTCLKEGFGQLHIMCGLSGSGKTSWVKSQKWDRVICLDDIRKQFTKDPLSRKFEGQVMQEAKKQVKEGLAKKEVVCYDATNLRKDFRKKLTDLADAYNAYWEIVFIDTSPNFCIKKDKNRNVSVGEAIIKKQAQKFEHPFF